MKRQDVENILKYTIIGGIFLLPFSIFIVSNSLFFPYITGKNFYLRIIVETIFALWVVLAMMDARYRPKMSWLLAAVVAFVALIAVSDATGVNPGKSFWSNFERMEGLISLLHFLAYFVVLISVFVKEKIWTYFWNTIVGVSLIQGFYVLSELGGGGRAEGTFGNPIYMAGFMLVAFFLTLWLLYRVLAREKTRSTVWLVIFYLSAMMLQTVGIFASGTRGSILGLFGGLVLTALLIAIFGRRHPRLRKTGAVALVLIAVLAGSFFAVRNSSFVQENNTLSRVANISLTEGTAAARLNLWGIAIEGVKERPILGWGQGNFIEVFSEHYEPKMYGEEPWFDRAHNIVLNWLVVGGILGLLTYLSLWVLMLVYFWHPRSGFSVPEKSILTGLLAAYFFHNLFVFDNVASYLLFFSILGYAHHRFTGERSVPWWKKLLALIGIAGNDKKRFGQTAAATVSVVLVALVVMSVYQLNIKPIGTANNLVKAASAVRQDPGAALPFFETSVSNSELGRTEARVQLALAASTLAGQNLDERTKGLYFERASQAMKEAIEENPNSVRQRIVHALLLNSYGRYEEAVRVTEEALAISPNYQRLYEQLGDSYMGLGEFEKALETHEAAWRLDEKFYSLRTGSVEALMAMGRFDEAAQIIEEGSRDIRVGTRGVILSGDDINEFIERGYIDVARKSLEALANASRNNPQGLVSAAAGFLQIGDREKSIELIRRAMEIEPRFVPQGQQLIEEIEAGGNPLE